jgi:hypothetical protein
MPLLVQRALHRPRHLQLPGTILIRQRRLLQNPSRRKKGVQGRQRSRLRSILGSVLSSGITSRVPARALVSILNRIFGQTE